MSEMIERVARAIAYEHCNRKQWIGQGSKHERCSYFSEHEYRTFLPAARAAMEAMREPTEEMKKAGRFVMREIYLGNGTTTQGLAFGDDPIRSYTKMINAALASHPADGVKE